MKDITMDNIKTMISEDSHRWGCPKYYGLVVVEPEMVEEVVSMICVEFPQEVESLNSQRKRFKLRNGGELTVTSMENNSIAEKNHAGCQYTSILWSTPYKVKFDSIAYMMTRLRSESKYESKFVMM